MSFEIRKAVLSDLGSAYRLDQVSFGKDAWTMMDYIGLFSFPGTEKFSAWVGGSFAGFAASELDKEENAVNLLTLAVSPEFRRQGIGASLLARCEKAFGRYPVYLYVDAENGPAIRLYRKAGYTQTDILRAYYMNGHDALVMEKSQV